MRGALSHTLCVPRYLTITVAPFGAFRTAPPGYHTFLSLHPSAAFTVHDSVRLSSFILPCRLTLIYSLGCDFCSSDQRFARRLAGSSHPASFRFHLTINTLCLRLHPSLYQTDLGLAPLRNVRRQAHKKEKAGRHDLSAMPPCDN